MNYKCFKPSRRASVSCWKEKNLPKIPEKTERSSNQSIFLQF
jgi:hypothetical protein